MCGISANSKNPNPAHPLPIPTPSPPHPLSTPPPLHPTPSPPHLPPPPTPQKEKKKGFHEHLFLQIRQQYLFRLH